MEGRWFVLACVKALCVFRCASSIVLESSLGETQAACAGEEVVFTCEIIGSGRLTWTIQPLQDNSIVFSLLDTSVNSRIHDSTGYFNAVVTNYSRNPSLTFLGNITSKLWVIASPESVMGGKEIACDDGISTTVPSLHLTMADLPSYPQCVTYNITSYSTMEYTVRVQWEAPSNDGGVGVNNYTITVITKGMVYTSGEISNDTSQVVLLKYERGYMFEVAASNCNGKGQYASFSISAVISCGQPSPPASGTIEPYSSTQEGAEIQYRCDKGHTPRVWMTSQCNWNGVWTPDPALLNCTIVNCGPPNSTLSTTLTFTATTYNSTATYMCRNGFMPSDVYTTVCTSNKVWEPDPNTLECRRIVDCGIPEPSNDATFNYSTTVEGSKMTITCNKGLFLQESEVEFVCGSNGSWTPNPVNQYCYEVEHESDSFAGVTSGVVVGVVVAVTMVCIGFAITLGLLLKVKLSRRIAKGTTERNRSNSPSPPVLPPAALYEEVDVTRRSSGHKEENIELKSNTAYAHVEKIVMSHDQAYGKVFL